MSHAKGVCVMSIFAGSILGTGENPLVTASKGELFVPIGDEDHPPLARRIILSFFALAVLISVALFVNRLYMQSITLPERNVAVGRGIHEIKDIPQKVTYADVEFTYEVTSFEGIITGCSYTAKMNADALRKVTALLLKCYGEPGDFSEIPLSELTEEGLLALGSATWTWNYGKHPIESLESLDSWGSNVAGYYINPTYLYMDMNATVVEDGEVEIEITYEVRPRY